MRTCCCCIPVLGGATFIGILGILLALAEMTPLTTYLIDFDGFNPIKENMESFMYILEDALKTSDVSEEDINQIKNAITDNLFTVFLTEVVLAGVYAIMALLMIFGIHCDMRGMMIPYMMYQMLLIVISILVGLALTVGLFFHNVIMGIVSAVVLLIVSFLLVYYWVAVQQAYVELGNRDYMYSPAPTKQYNGSSYPSAPQRFEMHERC